MLLGRFLPRGSRVLDYGCGLGPFLKALAYEGFEGVGVEYDAEAARYAAANAKRPVLTVAEFQATPPMEPYDAIYLCDVVAHLPDPVATLQTLLRYLKPDGVLFVEGPLPTNASPVYFAARAFGAVKRRLRPGAAAEAPPTHLFLANAVQHRALLARAAPDLSLLLWQIHETGWPYSEGGAIKSAIAGLALMLGGKRIGGVTFGNRFRAIYRFGATTDGADSR
jgi:SAM-dependent methyltransferase